MNQQSFLAYIMLFGTRSAAGLEAIAAAGPTSVWPAVSSALARRSHLVNGETGLPKPVANTAETDVLRYIIHVKISVLTISHMSS